MWDHNPARFALRSLLTIALLSVWQERGGAQELVDSLGAPDCWRFEGNDHFSAMELRGETWHNVDVRYAANPSNALSDLSRILAEQIQLGYIHVGFPRASVVATGEIEEQRVLVRIDEGPRFRAGPVVVLPEDSPVSSGLAAGMLTPSPRPADNSWFEAMLGFAPKTVSRQCAPCAWNCDGHAPFDAITLAQLEEQALRVLEDLGYYFARVHLEVVPDPEEGLASLVVTIDELGPIAVIDDIVIAGCDKITREQIIEFLRLEQGGPIDREHREQMAAALARCGRFTRSEVMAPMQMNSRGRAQLVIRVEEAAHVHPLDQEYAPEIGALLRAGQWLKDFHERAEDAVCEYQGPDARIESVFTPSGDAIVKVWPTRKQGATEEQDSAQSDAAGSPQPLPSLVLLFTQGKWKLYDLAGARRGEVRDPAIQLKYTWPNTFRFERADKESIARTGSFRLDITLTPAELASAMLNPETKPTVSSNQDELAIALPGYALRIEAPSGRVCELTRTGPDNTLRVTFRAGAFDERWDEIEGLETDWTRLRLPPGRLTRALKFCGLAADAAPAKLLTPENEAAIRMHEKFADQGIFYSIDDRIEWSELTLEFDIPRSRLRRPALAAPDAVWIAGNSYHIFGFLDRALDRDSRWWLLNNEWRLSMNHCHVYAGETVDRVLADDDDGPLTSFIAVYLLAAAGQDTSAAAERGLLQLSVEDFRRDYRSFLAASPEVRASIYRLATAIRSLSDDEADAMAKYVWWGAKEAAARLHATGDEPIETALPHVLDCVWEELLQPYLKEHLFLLSGKRYAPATDKSEEKKSSNDQNGSQKTPDGIPVEIPPVKLFEPAKFPH